MDAEAAGVSSFGLPSAFWSQFHAECWERRGIVLRAPLPEPLATADEVFRRLVDDGEKRRAGAGGSAPDFFIEQAQLLADVEWHLPGAGDASMAAWTSRVTAMLDGRKFRVVVDEFHAQDAHLWLRLREFARGLYALTGVAAEQAKAALFIGTEPRTPWGLHRGRSSNFLFVIAGHKRMRAWPDECFRGKPDLTNRLDYEPYLGDSVVLDGEPGDVIYWPSSYWHISEDSGDLAVAISLVLFTEDGSAAHLTDRVARTLQGRLERHGQRRPPAAVPPDDVAASARAIPGRVRQALRVVRAAGQEAEVEQGLIASRLDHLTGFGFRRCPPPRTAAPLTDEQRVRGHPEYPILWLPAGDGDLVVSANGRSFAIPANPRLVALFKRLNTGVPARVGELIRKYAGTVKVRGIEFDASSAELRSLLEKLDSLRALTTEGLDARRGEASEEEGKAREWQEKAEDQGPDGRAQGGERQGRSGQPIHRREPGDQQGAQH